MVIAIDAGDVGQRVYPRACGGTTLVCRCPPIGRGLSPRVRGNLLKFVFVDGPDGSIPARAGEPSFGTAPNC